MKKLWVTVALIALLCGITAYSGIRIANDSKEKKDLTDQISRQMDEAKGYQDALASVNEQAAALQADLTAMTAREDEAQTALTAANGQIDLLQNDLTAMTAQKEELEGKLIHLEGIDEVIVSAEQNELAAEIFSKDADDETKEAIRAEIERLNKRTPMYKRISRIVFREEEFPKTTSQKIIRRTEHA